jgi:hypothetical protein
MRDQQLLLTLRDDFGVFSTVGEGARAKRLATTSMLPDIGLGFGL